MPNLSVIVEMQASQELPQAHEQTVAVDFDGVLCMSAGPYAPHHYGPPIRKGLQLLRLLKTRGYDVVILTARNETDGVANWLAKHGFPGMFVTNHKIPAIAYVDDRAVHMHTDVSPLRMLQEIEKRPGRIMAGGPGSGCHGPNCGRPELYHGTSKQLIRSILKDGLRGDDAVWATTDKNMALFYGVSRGKKNLFQSRKGPPLDDQVKEDLENRLQVAMVVLKPEAANLFGAGAKDDPAKISRTDVPPEYIDRVEIYKYPDIEDHFAGTPRQMGMNPLHRNLDKEIKPVRVIHADGQEIFVALPFTEEADDES